MTPIPASLAELLGWLTEEVDVVGACWETSGSPG